MKTFCDSPPVRLIDPIPLEKVSISRETFSRDDIDSSFHTGNGIGNGRIERRVEENRTPAIDSNPLQRTRSFASF